MHSWNFTAKQAPFLVTGASGNVGGAVLRELLARGARVRAAVHAGGAAGNVVSHADQELETVRFDFTDASSYHAALCGCQGLFLMRPNPIFGVRKTLNRVLDVARIEGVRHCVFLSVAGAERNSMLPHHAVEQHLMRSDLRWTMLRAGFFSQNLTGPYLKDIRAGTLVLPAGDARVAYVDARDVAEVAAIALTDPNSHTDKAYHLTGPEALSFNDVAVLLSSELRRRVSYRAASVLGFWQHCRRSGVGWIPTLAYTLIHRALHDRTAAALDPSLERLLGRPGRSLRGFIAEQRTVFN